ncbi:cell division protein [Undibacterium terreum]|uniref:Uncharacterized protein n=1 Tax=Undibacterium terreum TaxID=1224302 RepID=A0A916UDY5_9BURK|nr:cell division protein [Undibacterium terreum]GGC68355.1 hypothetical protein GCM10011396_14220 [Undibacterium terreum]
MNDLADTETKFGAKLEPKLKTKLEKKLEVARPWLVRWMYAVVAVHLLVGLLLPWIAGLSVFDAYHHTIARAFWGDAAVTAGYVSATAHAQQVWWISLFGPTVQGMSLWMGALTYIGDRQRISFAWAWLIAGVVLWAPQDMLISLRADIWIHVWIDCFAVATMLPPLVGLYLNDRKPKASVSF